jgi:hypothetical protein
MFFIACFLFPVVMPAKPGHTRKWGPRKLAVDTKTARLRSIFRTIGKKPLDRQLDLPESTKASWEAFVLCFVRGNLERVMGIEPTLFAWEAKVLPLNYTRVETIIGSDVTCANKAPAVAAVSVRAGPARAGLPAGCAENGLCQQVLAASVKAKQGLICAVFEIYVTTVAKRKSSVTISRLCASSRSLEA